MIVLACLIAAVLLLAFAAWKVPAISNFIAGTGEKSTFIAAAGHSGWAFILSTATIDLGAPHLPTLIVWALIFALKEFWFDLKRERFPQQTILDSAGDYAGYLLGLALRGLFFL
jgi:hypothetical protein